MTTHSLRSLASSVRTSARERKRDKRTRDKRTREQEIRDVTTHSLRLLASSWRTSARERKRQETIERCELYYNWQEVVFAFAPANAA